MAFAVTPTYNIRHQPHYVPNRVHSAKDNLSTKTGSEAFVRYPNAHVHCALDKIPSPSGIQMMYPPEKMLSHMNHMFPGEKLNLQNQPIPQYPVEPMFHNPNYAPPLNSDPRFVTKINEVHSQRPGSALQSPPKCYGNDASNLTSEIKAKLLASTLRDLARKRMMHSWIELRTNTSMSIIRDSMKEIVATMSISDYAERVKVLFVPETFYDDASVSCADSTTHIDTQTDGQTDVDSVKDVMQSDFNKNTLPSVALGKATDSDGSESKYRQPSFSRSQPNLMKSHVGHNTPTTTSTQKAKIERQPHTHVVTKEVHNLLLRQSNSAKLTKKPAHPFKFDDIQETDSLLSCTDTQSTYTPRYVVEQRKREEEHKAKQNTPNLKL